jgi:hypothetical protein
LFYLIGFLYVQIISDNPYSLALIAYIGSAGFIIAVAFLFLNQALLSGKGALAITIS